MSTSDQAKQDTTPAAMARIADGWGLTAAELVRLQQAEPGGVGARVEDLLAIDADLHRLFSDRKLAHQWVRTPNREPEFAGARPLDMMLSQGVDGVEAVRRYLERWVSSQKT